MTNHITPQASSNATTRSILALAGLIALAIIVIPVYAGNDARPLLGEWFVGSDTYMRIIRVHDWWQAGLWYDSISARSNWPHGEVLHWTRPLDVLLIALAAPFWPFVGFEKALFISGVIVSPVVSIMAMWALVRGTRTLLDVRGQAILLVLFAFQPITRFYFLAARPDHHALILLAFTLTLGLMLRYAHDPLKHKNAPTWAGVATAFGIWVSIESLTTELFALAALGLPWLITGDQRWLSGLRRFTIAGALALAVMLGIEQPPSRWLGSEEFDRLSTIHVVLLALIALGVEIMWRKRKQTQTRLLPRLGVGITASLAAALMMGGLYPDFFKGPFGAAMDPRLDDLWLGKIQELQPLLAADWDTVIGAVHILGPTVWLAVWAWQRHLKRPAKAAFDEPMLIMVLAGLLYLPLTLFQVRWGAYLGVTVAVAWAAVLQNVLSWHGGPIIGTKDGSEPGTPILRVPLFVLIVLAHMIVGGGLSMVRPDAPANKSSVCKWRDIQPYLISEDFADGAPRTLLSHIHQGPEIMFRTPHRVIGSPYHRNTQGILDNYNALATTDDTIAREIMTRRGIDFVVLCTDSAEERHFLKIEGDTLIRRITIGQQPKWLQKMPLPSNLQEHFRILRFVPDHK